MLFLEVGAIVIATMVIVFLIMLGWHIYREIKVTSPGTQEVIPDGMVTAFREWEQEKGAK